MNVRFAMARPPKAAWSELGRAGMALAAALLCGEQGCGGKSSTIGYSADGGMQSSSDNGSSSGDSGGGSSSSGASSAPSDASVATTPSDASGVAACIAAGGKCQPVESVCPDPQDPALVEACGDPTVTVCCVPDGGFKGPRADWLACLEAGGSCEPTGLTGSKCMYGSIATMSCGDPTQWTCCAPPPDAALPELANCKLTAASCDCSVMIMGHLYGATCTTKLSDPCTCTVDNKATEQVANFCPTDPTAFVSKCGFP